MAAERGGGVEDMVVVREQETKQGAIISAGFGGCRVAIKLDPQCLGVTCRTVRNALVVRKASSILIRKTVRYISSA